MEYNVRIEAINPNVEEELLVSVNGVFLTVFVNQFLSEVKVGEKYPVTIHGAVDELEIVEQAGKIKEVEQIGDGFSYYVRGKFVPSVEAIDVGFMIQLEDEDFSGCWYLENKYIQLKVDRMELEFSQLEDDV